MKWPIYMIVCKAMVLKIISKLLDRNNYLVFIQRYILKINIFIYFCTKKERKSRSKKNIRRGKACFLGS